MKILLLEDDLALNDLLNEHLEDREFDVTLCTNGQEALEYLVDEKFDLTILDINTPGITGIEVLKRLRNEYKNNTPTIVITAYQDTNYLKESFENGVDDYIKKPFDLEELDQRINKLCKLFSIEQKNSMSISSDIEFIPDECLICKGDSKISVALKERDILKYFLTHKNRVISSDELLQNIWSYDDMPTDATIRVYIKNLRGIVGKDRIQTIRGIGYKFE